MYNVAVIVGSLRQGSINKKFARALEKAGAGIVNFVPLPIDEIPLYNGDLESPLPEPVARLKERIRAADALLFVTPEYNRSMPGVMKNVLDWASRPYGDSAWAGKPAAVCGCTGGATGTALAQSHLRNVLLFLDTRLMGQPEVYFTDKPGLLEEDGTIKDERTEAFLRDFIVKFRDFIATRNG